VFILAQNADYLLRHPAKVRVLLEIFPRLRHHVVGITERSGLRPEVFNQPHYCERHYLPAFSLD